MPHRPIGADDRDLNGGEADQPMGASDDDQRVTERREVARFDSYGDAQAAIDLLCDQGFAVDRMAISGRGLRYVEQVTGRRTLWRTACQGLATGAAVGALTGVGFWVFGWIEPLLAGGLVPALSAMLLGAATGALLGVLLHLPFSGGRDFSSSGSIEAEHYELTADARFVPDAKRVLQLFDARALASTRQNRQAQPRARRRGERRFGGRVVGRDGG